MDKTNRLILLLAAVFGLLGFGLSTLMFQGSRLVGVQAPDISLRLLSGESLDLAKLRSKPVLINVWATWCPPCIEELPMLDRAHRDGKLHVIALASDEREAVEDFLARNKFSFEVGFTQDDPDFDSYYAVPNTIPYSVLIDREGTIAAVHRGLMRPSDLQKMLAKAN
jgi:thiol-disulfide isomerase/thioredoxin